MSHQEPTPDSIPCISGTVNPDSVGPLQSMLQNVLRDHSHLDLTPYVIKNDKEPMSRGGYSNVYRCHLHDDWAGKHLANKIVLQLLTERRYMGLSLSPAPIYVAVKVLLLPNGSVDPMVENVRPLPDRR